MATGERVDPFVNFNFKVELDGIIQAAFHEVSGLDSRSTSSSTARAAI